ncbi:hypothetical protein RRSWK_03336 [Rhodopirellula sp. SWK7]|nr:hypothetical protein RRSWK_03336 [Rhodopirellula sp. SWK7]
MFMTEAALGERCPASRSEVCICSLVFVQCFVAADRCLTRV